MLLRFFLLLLSLVAPLRRRAGIRTFLLVAFLILFLVVFFLSAILGFLISLLLVLPVAFLLTFLLVFLLSLLYKFCRCWLAVVAGAAGRCRHWPSRSQTIA